MMPILADLNQQNMSFLALVFLFFFFSSLPGELVKPPRLKAIRRNHHIKQV